MFPGSPLLQCQPDSETLVVGCIQNRIFRNSGRGASATIDSWSAYPAIARYSSVFNGTLARIVVPAPGCDFTESSPCTNCSLSRMLIKPRPWRLKASCSSKPFPKSATVSSIDSSVPWRSTVKLRTPLCLTAFCSPSCKTRNKHSETSFGRGCGIPACSNAISTVLLSESSLQKLLAAVTRPR
jgi:hypothetical protein